jgi:hypothetical protein
MRWDYLILWITAIGNLFKRKRDIVPIASCLNCRKKLSTDIKFCPNCGQKNRYSKITVWNLLGEFLTSVLNIDNGAWRSLRNIIRPGFLAREYIEGRRKMYFNPVRFFLLALILHFSLITIVVDIDDINQESRKQYKIIGQSEIKKEFYNLKDSLFQGHRNNDLVDSLATQVFEDVKMPEDDTLFIDLNLGFVDLNEYPMMRKDVFDLSSEDLLDKYNVVDFWHRLAVSQFARAFKNLSGAAQFFIGNMIWGIVSTIFVLAFVMKVLYIRRKRYYVEHLMVLFDIHTFSFILFSIAFLIYNANNDLRFWPIATTGVVVIIYFFLSIKKYYQQGIIKSFIKFVIIGFSYLTIMMMMVGLVFIGSLLLYN